MPITQFAKIKIRRGLKADLPILDSSELGFTTDTREMYIGNSAPFLGTNTQILTEHSPNTDIIDYDYRSNIGITPQTGSSLANPTVRSIQQRLDDYVSIKAFGAVGDGIADDTVALNRAIEQLYTGSTGTGIPIEAQRRILFLPAGIYRVNSGTIKLPPHLHIIGEGQDRTIIELTNLSQLVLFETCDSDFNTGLAIGAGGAELPTNIKVEGITFEIPTDGKVIDFNRSSNISFDSCKFIGGYISGSSTNAALNFSRLGSIVDLKNYNFVNCVFMNFGNIINVTGTDSIVDNITFNSCVVENLWRFINIDNSSMNITLINNTINSLGASGVRTTNSASCSYISSIGNFYNNVGSGSNNPIVFGNNTTNCSSINDNFITTSPTNVSVTNNSCVVLNNSQEMVFQNIRKSSRRPLITLLPSQINTSTGIIFNQNNARGIFIDYTLYRGAVLRVGRLTIINDGLNVHLGDDYHESAPTGISFDAILSGGNVIVNYTSTAGSNGELRFDYKFWNNS